MQRLLAIILALLVTLAPLAAAQEDDATKTSFSEEEVESLTEAAEQSTLLLQLKQKLASAQYRHYVLENNIEIAKEGLVHVHDTITTLEEALENLDELIHKTEKKILSVKSQIEEKKMEISATEEEIQMLELQIEDQKVVVSELMTLLYIKRGIYYDDEGVNPVKVLASPHTVSQTLQKLTYLDMIEAQNQEQMKALEQLNAELIDKWEDLRVKRKDLDRLDEMLQGELDNLEAQRTGKQNLLDETRGEEAIYQTMLQASSESEADILREIEIFEENVTMMEDRLRGSRALLTEDQKAVIDKIESDASADFNQEEAADFLDLDWPVKPTNLNAFFIDPGYVRVFGVQHYALDISSRHGAPIFAPADGVVSQVVYKKDSTRYAYIMIAHRKGVMTLYGHVSEAAVKTGEYVTRGQIIGLSGGTPGTVGAGVRTTGPHLHFEVWQDGVRVDPLKYLPLEEVPTDELPEAYLQDMQAALENQILKIEEALLGR